MGQLPNAITTDETAREMLDAIVRFTREELPFVSQVAQLALQASTTRERERALVSLYRLGLEHGQPYVSDLADELLCWIERSAGDAA
jgi:hypothetical protein